MSSDVFTWLLCTCVCKGVAATVHSGPHLKPYLGQVSLVSTSALHILCSRAPGIAFCLHLLSHRRVWGLQSGMTASGFLHRFQGWNLSCQTWRAKQTLWATSPPPPSLPGNVKSLRVFPPSAQMPRLSTYLSLHIHWAPTSRRALCPTS